MNNKIGEIIRDEEAVWEQRKLGEVCQITMGQSPDGSTYSEEPSDYILVQGNADLKDGWVEPRIWTTQKTKTAQAGDLIMSVRAPAGAMGKTAYDVVLGRGVAGIKGNEFVYQLLVKMDSDGSWKKMAAGSTFESINSDVVKKAEILLPQDIEEQNKIGSYFMLLDHLITLHQRISLYFLKINTFVWEQRKLGNITVKIGSGKTPLGGKSAYVETGIPLIRSQNVNGDKVDFADIVYIDEATDELMANSRVYTNDVLLNITGASIGRSAVYKGLESANVNQHVCIIRPTEGHQPDFIQLNLSSDNGQKQIDASQAGGGREGLNFQEIGKMQFSFPSLNEQKAIGRYFNCLDHLITLHQRKPYFWNKFIVIDWE